MKAHHNMSSRPLVTTNAGFGSLLVFTIAVGVQGAFASEVVPAAPAPVSQPAASVGSSITDTTPDYRMAPRDSVQFQIYEDPDLLSVQRVSGSGEISVPMIGTVKIGGLTLREAEKILQKKYMDGGYYIKPQVILSVQAYIPRSVSVLGQVNHPDHIEFPVEQGSIGLVQAITLAGGFTRVARIDGVKVMRKLSGKEETININVSEYLDSKGGAEEFKLQPEDIVYVPERVF